MNSVRMYRTVVLASLLALLALGTVMRPVIWLLSVSTNVLVRLLGGDPVVERLERQPAGEARADDGAARHESLLDGAGEQALDEVALEGEEHHDHHQLEQHDRPSIRESLP